MLIEQTLTKFPATRALLLPLKLVRTQCNTDSAQLQEECALPFGFTLQPFGDNAHVPLSHAPALRLADLPRCSDCGAYLNCFNGVDMVGFRCALCGAYCDWTQKESRRYGSPQARERQLELHRQVFEVACPDYDDKAVQEGYRVLTGPFPAPKRGRPVFIAVVDVSASEEFLELAKLALTAALDALTPNTLVGLITLSDTVRTGVRQSAGRCVQIGLWDVKPAQPAVRNVAIFPSGEVMCPLEEALPLRALLAPVETCAAQLAAAVEGLQPRQRGLFGFGPAMHALMDYAEGLHDAPRKSTNGASSHAQEAAVALGPCRVACCLASAPNMGLGQTQPQDASTDARASAPPAADGAAESFYEQIGVLAAMHGVGVDVFAVAEAQLGLQALAPVCQKSGGACFFYERADGSSMPQDVVKRVRTPQALCALLRVRTCPELKVGKVYGKAQVDRDHENLWHVVAAAPHDSLTFSLELAASRGFVARSGDRSPQPCIQIAFQYSLLTHRDASSEDDVTAAVGGKVYSLQRRLRVLTVMPGVAKTHEAVYAGAQLDALATMLSQKVLLHSVRKGAADARVLLQPGHIDPNLERCPTLASLARVIYAFLRCPLLETSGQAAGDAAAYMRLLWTHLAPHHLLRAMHPVLVSFDDPESDKHERVTLSRGALRSAQGRVVLLDTFHTILVMYRAAALQELPFPPPAASKLRSLVSRLAAARGIAPEVTFCVEGDANARRLEAALIDEPLVGASLSDEEGAEAAKLGFAGWLQHVEGRVSQALERPQAA